MKKLLLLLLVTTITYSQENKNFLFLESSLSYNNTIVTLDYTKKLNNKFDFKSWSSYKYDYTNRFNSYVVSDNSIIFKVNPNKFHLGLTYNIIYNNHIKIIENNLYIRLRYKLL